MPIRKGVPSGATSSAKRQKPARKLARELPRRPSPEFLSRLPAHASPSEHRTLCTNTQQ